jgi:hypothetical protein
MSTIEVKRNVKVSRTGISENSEWLLKRKKRIPISKIYWKKGDYEELVDDPFNTGRDK